MIKDANKTMITGGDNCTFKGGKAVIKKKKMKMSSRSIYIWLSDPRLQNAYVKNQALASTHWSGAFYSSTLKAKKISLSESTATFFLCQTSCTTKYIFTSWRSFTDKTILIKLYMHFGG